MSAPQGESSPAEAPSVPGYRLLEEIGAGGSGVVWLALGDDALERPFAVKVFPQRGAAYERELATLTQLEAIRAAVGSRDLVEVVGAGEVGDQGYVVMEYVRGGSLAERLAREGPLAPEVAVELLLPVLRALELLHGAGVVHKDVKPANVLVGEDGHPRLGDFGLARPLGGPVSSAGTPGFCAPELYAGDLDAGASELGERVDVYSAGATLYALLSGQAPLPGRPDLFLLERQRVDRRLQEVLFQALALDPAQRLASAAAFREALEAWQRGEPAAPVPEENAEDEEPAPPPSGRLRRPSRAGLALIVLGLGLGLGGGAAWLSAPEPEPLLFDGRDLTPVGPPLRWQGGSLEVVGRGVLSLFGEAPADAAVDGEGRVLAAVSRRGEAVAVDLVATRVLLRVPAPELEGDLVCAVASDGRYLARALSPTAPDVPTRVELFGLADGQRVLLREDLAPAAALALTDTAGADLPTLLLGGPDGRVRWRPPSGPGGALETHGDAVVALANWRTQGLLLVAGDDRRLSETGELAPRPKWVVRGYRFEEGALVAQPWTRQAPEGRLPRE